MTQQATTPEEARSLNQLLAELAYIAGGYGLLEQVDAITGALAVLRPESALPSVIRATARLNHGDYDQAERILRDEALAAEPNSAMAKAHLGLAMKLQGRAGESERLLQPLAADTDDPDAAALASQVLARH